MAERNSSGESTWDRTEVPELVPLTSVVDLARHPERSALALWYAHQIAAGTVGVYGLRSRRWGWAKGEPEPIPVAEMAGFLIEWSDGTAVAWEADSQVAGPAWEGLCVACPDARPDVPASDAETLASDALCVSFTDARRLVHRWRELAALPPGWWLPEGEFWQAQPAARPDRREAERYLVEAIKEGRLKSFIPLRTGEWAELPASTWERVDAAHGRVNLGATPLQRARAVNEAREERTRRELESGSEAVSTLFDLVPGSTQDRAERLNRQKERDWLWGEQIELPPELAEHWVLAIVKFADLRSWFDATFAPRSAEPGEASLGSQASTDAEARPKIGGRPIKDFWPRVLGWAAGWLAANGAPPTQAELERVIADRVADLERQAEPTQVATYARELLEGFREHIGR